jgi:hypothetical protein
MAKQIIHEIKSSIGGRFQGKCLEDSRQYWCLSMNFLLIWLMNILKHSPIETPLPRSREPNFASGDARHNWVPACAGTGNGALMLRCHRLLNQ